MNPNLTSLKNSMNLAFLYIKVGFLAIGEVGAGGSVNTSGVPGGIGIAQRYLRSLGTVRIVGTSSGSNSGGELKGRNSRHVKGTSGYTQSGVNVVVAVGVVGAGSGADTGGPYLLGGSRGHGNQSQERCNFSKHDICFGVTKMGFLGRLIPH